MKPLSLFTWAITTSLALAAPTPDGTPAQRQTHADAPAALAIVSQLFTDVTQYTAVINTTAASLSSSAPTAADNTTFTSAIASINTLVVDATRSIVTLPHHPAAKHTRGNPNALATRQTDPTGLAAEVAMVIVEIGGALNQIIATLGLTATLAFLGPLVGSLSLLLAALIPVVNNLLALVQALLDGILGGLSLALAGLVL